MPLPAATAVLPWLMDALQLYLTLDQEREITALQRAPEGAETERRDLDGSECVDLDELAEFMENENADKEECCCEYVQENR